MRLIDINDVNRKLFERSECDECTDTDCHSCFQEWLEEIPTIDLEEIPTIDLEEIPTIDAVPVVHAHWIDENNPMYPNSCHCSNCQMTALTDEETLYDYRRTDYCSFCGAKMDEE